MNCPDCDALTRRTFVKGVAATAAASAVSPLLPLHAADPPAGETLAAQLYNSLKEPQRQALCFPFDHPLRQKVDNNWHIVKQPISQALAADQQDLVKQIFTSLHSEPYAQTVYRQVEHDNAGNGGFGSCAVAIFGQPGTGQFEFVFTGRHVTRRCDGDSVAGAAFGGPIFYGHAAAGFHEPPDHPGNAYWFQARRANELYKALDGRQRKLALRDDPRKEQGNDTVKLTANPKEIPGLPGSDLTPDQKQLLKQTLADLLAPFRPADVAESMKLIDSAGGLEALHLSFYKNLDIGNDGVWDVWQVQGPTMLWYFRGAPHVHTWVNIAAKS